MSLFVPDTSQSPEPQEDEDDISITSTDPGDGDNDKDWNVDDVLAERPHPTIPHAKQYLIKWEGFELHDSTWEPTENLGEGLLDQWKETKAEIEAGLRQPFDLSLYEAACAPRAARHARRNAKRQRLGLPLTPPYPPGYTEEVTTDSGDDDQGSSDFDDEAEEVVEVDPCDFMSSHPKPKSLTEKDSSGTPTTATATATTTATPAATVTSATPTPTSTSTPNVPTPDKVKNGAAPTRKVFKQKIFTGIPSPAPQKDGNAARTPVSGAGPRPPSLPPKPAQAATTAATTGLPPKPPVPARKSSGGTLTGYQGTARRSSLFTKPSGSKLPSEGDPTSAQKPLLTINTAVASLPTSGNKPAAKRLTATRTRRPPVTPAINVFAGGKPVKKRKNLGDVMADPSKAPKVFSTLRIKNLARKRGIEKEDAAGSLASIPASFLIGGDDDAPSKRPSVVTSPTKAEPPLTGNKTQPPNGTLVVQTAALRPKPPAEPTEKGSATEARNPKRKKAVRFLGEEDTDMLDAAGYVSDGPVEVRERRATQTVEKSVKFGHSQPLEVKLIGIPQRADAWISVLQTQELLDFRCTCTAFHFFSQRYQLILTGLSGGALEAVSDRNAAALENVAESLRRSSLALHLVAADYSIIVYPAKCDKWDWIHADFKGVMDNSSQGPLRHFIFRSADTLPPQAYPSHFFGDPVAFNQLIRPNGLNDPEIVGILTKLDWHRLQPQDPKLKDKQAFMLLIPLKAQQLIRVVETWLRLHAPDRPIFTVEQPGSWRHFHELVADGAAGTIISHCQFTLWKLEKIPGMWRMLENQKYTFWNLDTGETSPPQFPSDEYGPSVPGTLRLTRLFPFGRVFFITPSFAISEPAKLCSFLEWFKLYAANPGHMLVTCHDFPQFLRGIVEEKELEQRAVVAEYQKSKNVTNLLDRIGRSDEDIENHSRAWELLQDIMIRYGGPDFSQDVRKIHWLEEFIDPNDEQSLVNSFCWWSQTKLDKFRRFYVLGSDPGRITRAYRYIDIPRYGETDGSDPDIAGILIQRGAVAVERQKEADRDGTEINIAWGTGGVVENFRPKVVGEWRQSVCEPPFSFPGTVIRTDTVYELQRWIDNHKTMTRNNWSELHGKPVAWRDWNMAVQFNDGGENSSQFDTFSSWFSAAPSTFTPSNNSYFGLFYTITEDWDEYMPKRKYDSHPWIAILRPKNPHRLRQQPVITHAELYIWDTLIDSRAKYGDALLDMQRQLIDYVNEETRRKYPDCVLADVWYSSLKEFPTGPGDNPLDITCLKIQELFENSRTLLPINPKAVTEYWTLLDARLWKDGISPMGTKTRPFSRPSELRLTQIPQREEDLRKPERMVFHAVSRTNGARTTKCLNHLYETCLQARLKDPAAGVIRYQYRPTRKWWTEQMEEGRGYGYIHVDVGGSIITKLPAALSRDD